MRGVNFIETLLQDLCYGLRQLRRNPGFTAVAVITLALGISAASTIFSWIDSTLLNPIPGVTHTGDMVTVGKDEVTQHPTPPFSYPDYSDLRKHNHVFSSLLAYHDYFMSLTGGRRPQRIYGALTSANYFSVLGVRPILGRSFRSEDESQPGGAPIVVISYAMWQSRFNANPSIIGQVIHVNRRPYTIVGVAPPDFEGCKTGLRDDVWIPLSMVREVGGLPELQDRNESWLNLLGRLKAGVSRHKAQAGLNIELQQIAAQFPDSHRGPNQITLDPLWRSPFGVNVYLYKTLAALLGLAVVLLLLACANVANLFLVRLAARGREIALRQAMGAGRWRVVRQLLSESVLIALGGGAAAMVLTAWTAAALGSFFQQGNLPLTINAHANWTVLLATLAISMLAAVIFGILPALRTSRLAPATLIKEEEARASGGLHRSRLSKALVVAQISLSLVLLIAAGLFARSFQNEQRTYAGFNPSHVLIASYDLEPRGYSEVQEINFDQQLLAKLRGLPGVKAAALADFSPLNFTLHSDSILPQGYVPQPHESMEMDLAFVSPDYFRTLRTPLVQGREFTARDDEKSQPVAIVNQAFAERYWPGKDASGKSVKWYGRSFAIVGVARNAKYRLLRYPPAPMVFLPVYQVSRDQLWLHVRVAGNPGAFAPAIENAMNSLNPDLPLFDVTTLEDSTQLGSVFERVAATLVGSFGLLALVLAAVGIYGVIAFATRQRTHEIGIRIALGAQKSDVLNMVIGQGLKMALIGLVIGIIGALALTRFLSNLLYGVTPTDPTTFAAVSLILIGVALLACYIPARRATKVDPMVALRHE